MAKPTQMDSLYSYLKEHEYNIKRYVERTSTKGMSRYWRDQIIVFDAEWNRQWDAINCYGSYGCEQGLLEIMGDIVHEASGDSVVGWLTAQDVIDMLERK